MQAYLKPCDTRDMPHSTPSHLAVMTGRALQGTDWPRIHVAGSPQIVNQIVTMGHYGIGNSYGAVHFMRTARVRTVHKAFELIKVRLFTLPPITPGSSLMLQSQTSPPCLPWICSTCDRVMLNQWPTKLTVELTSTNWRSKGCGYMSGLYSKF